MSQHVDEVIGAYALGALEADEHREVERHLAVCERCQSELEATEEALALLPLALDAVVPSPELKGKLLAAVNAEARGRPEGTQALPEAQPHAAKPIPIDSRRHRSMPRWAIPAFAAAAVILIVGGILVGRSQQQSAQQQYAAFVQQATSQHETLIHLKPVHNMQGKMTLAVTKSGQASLIVGPTEPPPRGKVYELWYMNLPAARPVMIFTASKSSAQVLKLAVSPRGFKLTGVTQENGPNGSAVPTSKPVLVAAV